jgi:hypothetical protein
MQLLWSDFDCQAWGSFWALAGESVGRRYAGAKDDICHVRRHRSSRRCFSHLVSQRGSDWRRRIHR